MSAQRRLYAMRRRRATKTRPHAPPRPALSWPGALWDHRRWYGQRAVRGHPLSSITRLAIFGGFACLFATGCGETRQDAHEPTGRYTVSIARASFPAQQRMVQPSTLELEVRNTSAKTMPNVAITLDSLSYIEKFPHLSDPRRPAWIIDEGPGPRSPRPVETNSIDPPGGGQTAYVNTWALGALAPGHTRTFTWHLTPVKAGIHKVDFAVAAGLSGKARAVLADGSEPTGHFTVDIASTPAKTSVNPQTGQIRPGSPPVSQTPVGVSP